MANELKWKAPTARTTGISSTTIDDGDNLLSSEIANETNLDRWLDLELTFTAASSITADKIVECYVIYALDGTNYEDGDETPIDPVKSPICIFAARTGLAEQVVTNAGLPIRPFNFKLLLKSEFGQNVSGVTLDAETANEEIQ